ncbi:MAG TPA: hypothetical protein DDW52_03025 [Planctomycetaceae bacterium]|nr:hypothetical protein [Planctomycetaceae bacterium]
MIIAGKNRILEDYCIAKYDAAPWMLLKCRAKAVDQLFDVGPPLLECDRKQVVGASRLRIPH